MISWKPSFFSKLDFSRQETSIPGEEVLVAECGCTQTFSRATSGPLEGHRHAGGRFFVCKRHTEYCADCGRQSWPHNDCQNNDCQP